MKDLKIEDLKVGDILLHKETKIIHRITEISCSSAGNIRLTCGIDKWIRVHELSYYSLVLEPKQEEQKHNDHYKAQGIDTFTRMRANATKEEALGFIKYNIDKYNMRSKGQDKEDFEKMKVYCDEGLWWLNNKS